jgi:hypothetical protein
MVLMGTSQTIRAQEMNPGEVHIGFFYPVSSHGRFAGSYTNSFSFNVITGLSKNETGFALYGIAGVIKDSAGGVQIAGISNLIQNRATGVQIAGIVNDIRKGASGLQIAGITNITGTSDGTQIAGFCNLSAHSRDGLQIAGFMNLAGDVNTQIGGFMNKAGKVKAVQIAGFLNIADSSDYPIGLVNLIKNGEKSIGLSVDETLTTYASLRSGSRIMYGILGIGYNWKSDQSLYALEAGIGAHLLTADNFRINAEIAQIWMTDFKKGQYLRSSLRLLPAYKIKKTVELYAGPSFNFVTLSDNKGADLVNHYVWSETTASNHFHGLYFGVIGGIAIRF